MPNAPPTGAPVAKVANATNIRLRAMESQGKRMAPGSSQFRQIVHSWGRWWSSVVGRNGEDGWGALKSRDQITLLAVGSNM